MKTSTTETENWEELFSLPLTDPRPVPPQLAALWDEVAARNTWIRDAYDPPFEGAKVRMCASRDELRRWLSFGNYSNGSAFALEDGSGQVLCFIQQGECSDEWLAVKSRPTTFKGRPALMHVAFESISWHYILTGKRGGGREYFEGMLNDMFAATLDECRTLGYKDAAQRKARGDTWTPSYAPWRHGGWYVTNVRYASGACGCVSRNYADSKWRIVCAEGSGPGEPNDRTFKTRDDAARAERERAEAERYVSASLS